MNKLLIIDDDIKLTDLLSEFFSNHKILIFMDALKSIILILKN